MTWSRIPPPKPTPPGEWEAFTYGSDYRGWILRCGPAFDAHIHQQGGGDKYFTMLNGKARNIQTSLTKAQAAVEEEIINSVRVMLPAYKVIFERVQQRGLQEKSGKVTVLHSNNRDS